MAKYVIKRLLIMIPTLIAVGIIMFTLMNFVPGDPAQLALGSGTHTAAEIELKREAMGLNRPFVVRLGEYVENIFFHFDFGTSLIDGTEIKWELMKRFPHTLKIAIFSILLTILVGLPLGIYTAMHANSVGDKISLFITLLFDCMPSFWTALLLVLLFSLKLGWLPSSGCTSLKYFILPTIANSLGGLAGFTRQVRASMLEVVRSDYVTTARSKGLPEKDVIYGHALPNALIPILTVVGMRFGSMLGGATIIEVVFSIPGIGQYLVNCINNRDYTASTGGIVFIAFTFALIMLLTDLLYAFVDPRIKAQYVSANKKRVKDNG
ncbi:MAG: ABC transporter permease [Lachnospiraceae bacterium]|nr:ABC transporter permease [Lachnospiraceae bacterium]